uniref:Flagellar associated protein n=1 Tax=Tetraselmis sp. GSL018 TaxID=582737 RepID=A0A061QQH5_9CHLO
MGCIGQRIRGRLFDPQKARATIETLRLVRHRGSNLASDSLDTELAQLFVDAVLIWKNGSVTEALDVEWLANYLRFEAGVMYESWFFEDAIWAIYSFFCWHLREDFWEAHQDLCLLAGINESESRLISMAERAPSENCRTSQFVSTRASHLTSSRFSRSIRNSASRLSEAE